jgi:hypothetical protein
VVRKQVRLLAVILAASLCLPAASAAQAPGDRVAAQEMSFAAYRLRVAVKARLPQIEAAAAITRAPACRAALRGATPAQERRHVDDLVGVLVDLLAGAMLAPAAEPLRTFQAELDRIPVTDPVLRSGRAAWRSSVALYSQVRPIPTDLCAQLGRWRTAGYAASSRPDLQPPTVRRILEGSGTVDAKLHAAAGRMAALGVPEGQARRFAGDTLFDGFSAEDLLGLSG